MKKIQLLVLGYSNFLRRRVLPAIKKIRDIEFSICSKSNKINSKEKILFNDYEKALSQSTSEIVYISLINSLHFKYAKKALEKGFNVIVDKPITNSLYETKKLVQLAQKKNLLLAEATLYNYHNVFNKMMELCNGKKNILHINAEFNVPLIKKPKEIISIKGDCEMDMGPYAASIIRLFTKDKIKELKVFKEYFKSSNAVKNFFIFAKLKNCTFSGNFGFDRAYISQITFFTKNKIISLPHRTFALPAGKNIPIIIKENNKTKKINVKRDDCVRNFFKKILKALKSNDFKNFSNNLLIDAIIREKIKQY